MPEFPKEKRPCLLCKKPGHIARECPNKPAMAVEGAPLSAEEPRPAYQLMVRGEEEQKTKRLRGKPIDKVLDADGFQVVRGGFIPRPGGS